MTECKRCHKAITMFWWPLSFGDWEDRFYLCDDCLLDFLDFMDTRAHMDMITTKMCPFCHSGARLSDPAKRIYKCPICGKKFDVIGKEVPQ